jgi:hypothetical protein
MRIGALHDLAVELEHRAQDTTRRGMLRSKIDREIAGFVIPLGEEMP